jgi:hypothetical protein
VVVYRAEGRQRKQSADTLAEARAIKLKRDGEARAKRRGPMLHEFSLSWLDRYAGTGHDSVRANTRREYRRLLVNFALSYFDREVRVGELGRAAVHQFVDWLTTRPGRDGRLCDRSISSSLARASGMPSRTLAITCVGTLFKNRADSSLGTTCARREPRFRPAATCNA